MMDLWLSAFLSQNSPSSLILFTEDDEKNERYIEIKNCG